MNTRLTFISVRDRKKEYASSKAAYYPFGVDVYLSRRKISHIARLIELPPISHTSMIPAIMVVNVQVYIVRKIKLRGQVIFRHELSRLFNDRL